jgi:hypothetical protein
LIWTGKTKKVSHTLNEVIIEFESQQPFRDIQIPNVRSTEYRIFQPIVYGNFTKAESGANIGYDFVTDAVVHPVPVVFVAFDKVYAANHQTDSNDARLHIWEKNCRDFVTLEIDVSPYYDDTTYSHDGLPCSTAQADLHHGWYTRPIDFDSATNEFTSPENAYDTSATTYAEDTDLLDESGSDSHVASGEKDLVLMIPKIVYGRVKTFKVRTTYIVGGVYQVYVTGLIGMGGATIDIKDYTFPASAQSIESITTGVANRGADATIVFDSGVAATVEINWTTELAAADYVMPESVVIKCTVSQVGTGTHANDRTVTTATYKIHDVTLLIDSDLNQAGDPENASKTVSQLIHLYSGSDGFAQGYTDGEGGGATLASEVHQAHRDLMDRFGGVDYDNDYMQNWNAGAPGDYDLDTARTGWNVRWWQLEPRDLKEILEMLQYEGCFIFVFVGDSNGSGNPGGRYIWVQNSYSSVDVVATLTEDDYEPESLQISHVDPSEIVTKRKFHYNRHPAEDVFLQEAEYDNSTDRTKFNFTAYNIEEVDLEALVNCGDNTDSIYDTGSTDGDNAPNETIVRYYDRITSQPRTIVNCRVVNKSKFKLEYGDIIQFNDGSIDPFRNTWAATYFMVVAEQRSISYLDITAREVYIG